ncbi:MAG: adenylate/guanylate cyclase domain-containing protein [Geminicoccaceae bacterium]
MVQPSNRPIATIVSLDLHGYSRLTEQDEIGTHRALRDCMQRRLRPLVHSHAGAIVKETGDGAILCFAAATAAMEAMIRFQREVTAAEAAFPPSRRLVFRIGIHLAPMIHEKGDVFGHGVNLAVRLQEVAEPGSIFLSDAVARHLDPERSPVLDRAGRRTLKNIEERIDIFCWWGDACRPSGHRQRSAGLLAAALVAGMILPTAALDNGDAQNSDDLTAAADTDPSSVIETPAHAALPPIGEGWLRPYLGLAGSPLDTGVRTTLASAERSLETRAEIAEDAYLQALALYGRHTPVAFAQAIGELEQALRLQPAHGSAHALLAAVYWGGLQNRWQLGRGLTHANMLRRAEYHLDRVTKPNPCALMVRSEMLTAAGRHNQAIEKAARAIDLDPARAVGHHAKGRALLFAGRAPEAIAPIRKAIRLDPHASRHLFSLALAQFTTNRFGAAERTLARATAQNADDDWPHLLLAATRGHLGQKASARAAIGRFDALSVPRRGWFATQIPYVHRWPFLNDEDSDRLHLGMVLAGIPEAGR